MSRQVSAVTESPGSKERSRQTCSFPGQMVRGGVYFPPLLFPSVLLLLREQPNYGYALIKKLAEIGVVDPGMDPSQLYRVLRMFEERGLVVSEHESAEGRGPVRKVYRLTESGKEALTCWQSVLERATEVIEWMKSKYRELM